MNIIKFEEIQKLGITPTECVAWAETVIKNKKKYILPHKISITYDNNCYFNTMPAYLPDFNIIGVKEVSRVTGREPTLQGDILLYDSLSGHMKCFMDGTWITTWRTAAVAAITVEALKKKNAKNISILGLGNIARAFVMCIDEMRKHAEIELNILAYKDQHTQFIERFKNYENLHISVYKDVKEMFKISDVIVSCVTATNEIFDDNDGDFKPGVLVVPVMTRGFQNCDLKFDRIFCDDIAHISGFKYFNQYKSVTEMTDILNDEKFVRNQNERYLAYNIGIAVQDIFYANRILNLMNKKEDKKLQKFWV